MYNLIKLQKHACIFVIIKNKIKTKIEKKNRKKKIEKKNEKKIMKL